MRSRAESPEQDRDRFHPEFVRNGAQPPTEEAFRRGLLGSNGQSCGTREEQEGKKLTSIEVVTSTGAKVNHNLSP